MYFRLLKNYDMKYRLKQYMFKTEQDRMLIFVYENSQWIKVNND